MWQGWTPAGNAAEDLLSRCLLRNRRHQLGAGYLLSLFYLPKGWKNRTLSPRHEGDDNTFSYLTLVPSISSTSD